MMLYGFIRNVTFVKVTQGMRFYTPIWEQASTLETTVKAYRLK